jgi:hypothetical protein
VIKASGNAALISASISLACIAIRLSFIGVCASVALSSH